MNVYKPKGSKVYYARFQVSGKRYNRSTKSEDKTQALRILRLIRNGVIAGRWSALEETKFASEVPTIDKVIEVYRSFPKRCCYRTQETNVNSLLRLVAVLGSNPGRRRVSVLNRDLVEKWMQQRQGLERLDRSTRRQINLSINSGYNHAKGVFADYLMGDFKRAGLKLPDLEEFRRVPKLPTPKAGWEPWPREAYDAMHKASLELREANPELWLVNQMLRRLGLRNSELLAARREWIVPIEGGGKALKIADYPDQPALDGSPGGYRVKGALPRALPLAPDLLEILEKREGWLIEAPRPSLRRALIERAHNQWIRQFIPDRTKGNHELRKHIGSVILTQHGIEAAQRFLGHVTPETTRKWYATFLGGQVEISAEQIANYTGDEQPEDDEGDAPAAAA